LAGKKMLAECLNENLLVTSGDTGRLQKYFSAFDLPAFEFLQ
jgi:hypothetical protein